MRSLIGPVPVVAALCLTLAACASFPVNPPIERVDPDHGYRLSLLGEPGPEDETFVILSLSGGGTRAMALEYGVLRELDGVAVTPGRSLLDEADVMTTSSAAALVAAYYAWRGKEAFLQEFPETALYANLQGALVKRISAPWNWPRLWSGKFSRSDLADEYLDREIFHGATFADLSRERPFVLINAADMSRGSQFPFLQGVFDALCSDLDGVRLSRAVTAGMAFSGGFTPLALRNYPKSECGYRRPAWIDEGLAEPLGDVREHDRAVSWASYEDDSRPWVHLLDSGIADNIGIRALSLAFAERGEPWSIVDRIESGAVRRLVVFLVDARAEGEPKRDRSPKAPRLVSVLSASAGSPMSNYSSDTIELVRRVLAEIEGIDVYFIHLRFDAIADAELRKKLKSVPTSLALPRATVDLLIESAPVLLETSPDYRRLLEDLRSEAAAAPVGATRAPR